MNRWWILGPAFCAALALVLFSESPTAPVEVSEPVQRVVRSQPAAALRPQPPQPLAAVAPATAPAPGATAMDGVLTGLVDRSVLFPRDTHEVSRKDLFAGHSWAAPPPPPSQEPVAVQTAPELPYTYLGKKREDGAWEVFLGKDEVTTVAKEGETLDGVWRVEKIAPPTLQMVYLPMNHVHSVVIGDED